MDTAKDNFNLASRGTDLQQEVLFANFNQGCHSIMLATKGGYYIYSLDNVEDNYDVKLLHHSKGTDSDICLLERFFSSSCTFIVFASLKSPRKLRVYKLMKKNKENKIYDYN